MRTPGGESGVNYHDALERIVGWSRDVKNIWRQRDLMVDLRFIASAVVLNGDDPDFYRYDVPVFALDLISPELGWDRRRIVAATAKLAVALGCLSPEPLVSVSFIEMALDDPELFPDILIAEPDQIRTKLREAFTEPFVETGVIWFDSPAALIDFPTVDPVALEQTAAWKSDGGIQLKAARLSFRPTCPIRPVEELLAELRQDLGMLGRIRGQFTWSVVFETAGRYEADLEEISGQPIEDGSLGRWLQRNVDDALFIQFVRTSDTYATVHLARRLVSELSLLKHLADPAPLVSAMV